MLGKKLVAVSCFYGLKFACLHVSRFFIIFLDIYKNENKSWHEKRKYKCK